MSEVATGRRAGHSWHDEGSARLYLAVEPLRLDTMRGGG